MAASAALHVHARAGCKQPSLAGLRPATAVQGAWRRLCGQQWHASQPACGWRVCVPLPWVWAMGCGGLGRSGRPQQRRRRQPRCGTGDSCWLLPPPPAGSAVRDHISSVPGCALSQRLQGRSYTVGGLVGLKVVTRTRQSCCPRSSAVLWPGEPGGLQQHTATPRGQGMVRRGARSRQLLVWATGGARQPRGGGCWRRLPAGSCRTAASMARTCDVTVAPVHATVLLLVQVLWGDVRLLGAAGGGGGRGAADAAV